MSWFKKLADHARAVNEKDSEIMSREEESKEARNAAIQEYEDSLHSCAHCHYLMMMQPPGSVFNPEEPYCRYYEVFIDDPKYKTCHNFWR